MTIRKHKSPRLANLASGASVLVFALALPSVAWAQDAEPQYTGSGGISEIIVTARRRVEDLQDQPLSITALSADTLEQQNIQRLDDLTSIPNVKFNSGAGYANSLSLNIRGIGESDPILTNDSPIGFYVDGVLYARQIGTNLEVLDPERIEILRGPQSSLFGRNTTGGAINITTRAPSDDMGAQFYGAIASDDELVARAILNTGQLSDFGIKAKLTIQHRQTDGFVRNLNNDNGKYWYGSDTTDSAFGAVYLGNGDLTAELRGDWSKTKGYTYPGQMTYASPATLAYFSQSPSFGGDPFLVSESFLSALYGKDAPLSSSKVYGGSLTLNYAISDAVNFKSITAYRKLRLRNYASVTGQGNLVGIAFDSLTGDAGVLPVQPFEIPPEIAGEDTGGDSRQDQWTQEFQVFGEMGRHKYIAGLFYFKEDYGEYLTYNFTYPADIFIPGTGYTLYSGLAYNGSSKSYAFYVSDTWTPPIFDEKLEVTGGFRFTHDKKAIDFPGHPFVVDQTSGAIITGSGRKSYSQPSGDLTLSYHWTDDVMTYLRWANGYKSGGFSGRDGADQTGFDPETANNFEFGLKSTLFDRKVRFNANVFYTLYKDKQVSTYIASDDGGQPVNRVQNAGKAEYKGVEADLLVLPMPWLELSGSFGYTDPKYKEFFYQPTPDSPVVNIADSAKFTYFSKTNFSVGSKITVPDVRIGTLSFSVNYSYQSGTYFHPSSLFSPLNEIIKGGRQNDLSANIMLTDFNLGPAEATLTLYGKNLLNEHWRVSGVDYEFGYGFNFGTNGYNRPRVYGASLNLEF